MQTSVRSASERPDSPLSLVAVLLTQVKDSNVLSAYSIQTLCMPFNCFRSAQRICRPLLTIDFVEVREE